MTTLRRVEPFDPKHARRVAFVVSLIASAVLACGSSAAQAAATQRVRLPLPAYDGTLTPYTFGLGYPLVTLVYDTLLWRDADGIPRPWLARSVTRHDGGRRLTVRLRDGVRWHDGRPLTAADVVFTFRYVAAHYQPRFTPQVAAVRSVRATGRLTATIDLLRPSLGFEDQPLADLPILPRHLWQRLAPGEVAPRGTAVGSGPYRLVSASRRHGYVLRANNAYFQGTPRVREIRVPIIGDADRTYAALRDRLVDSVPLNLSQQAATDVGSTLGIALRRGPSYVGTALLLNVRQPPFDRPATRRAVAGALDVRRIARAVAPATAAVTSFIHPGSRWSVSVPAQPTDAAATRDVLSGLPPLRVMAPNNDPVRLEAGRQVVLALRRAGARATLVARSRARLDRAIGADRTPASFEAAIQSTPALASYDPDYLTRLFGSDARLAPLNFGGYRSAAFDAAARRVAAAPSVAARRRALAHEVGLLARDAPSIPLFFSQGTFAYRSAVYNGWIFVKGTGILDKRSFLPTAGGAAAEPLPASVPDAGPGTGEGSGLSVIDVISLIVLAIVVVLAGAALVSRRPRRG